MRRASRPKTLRSLRPRARRGRHAITADPITTEIILGAFETICYEMATHVSLTATTPILNQSNERNATILDGAGQLAALSVGIPQFMLSSTLPVRFAVEFFGPGGLFDGDVLVANDPYHGGGHLPDYNVFAPVFHGGECVLIDPAYAVDELIDIVEQDGMRLSALLALLVRTRVDLVELDLVDLLALDQLGFASVVDLDLL